MPPTTTDLLPDAATVDGNGTPAPVAWAAAPPRRASLAIVGGGFSGLMTAFHALSTVPEATAVIFERLPRARPGVAYGAADEAHLLNVRANRMGLTSDDEAGFWAWLSARFPGQYAASDFVPRRLFGDYLNEFIRASFARFGGRLALVRDGVESVRRTREGLVLGLASGAETRADAVVLALGLPAPGAPWSRGECATAAVDPWTPSAFADLAVDAPVVVLGTGLTALDVLVSLTRRGHRGPITFVSRHGRFPLAHAAPPATPSPVTVAAHEIAAGPRRALRELRRAARHARAAGRAWQEAVDAVRPHTTPAWQAWTDVDRQRFLSRLRPFWEIHRHRAPGPVLQLVDDGTRAGRVQTLQGTIVGVTGNGPFWSVEIRTRRGEVIQRPAARIFNCVGPVMQLVDSADPLVRSLLASGLVSTDAAALGLRADLHGRAVDAGGQGQDDLYVVGALRRGDLWESTAVPELRNQARTTGLALAERLTASLVAATATAAGNA